MDLSVLHTLTCSFNHKPSTTLLAIALMSNVILEANPEIFIQSVTHSLTHSCCIALSEFKNFKLITLLQCTVCLCQHLIMSAKNSMNNVRNVYPEIQTDIAALPNSNVVIIKKQSENFFSRHSQYL